MLADVGPDVLQLTVSRAAYTPPTTPAADGFRLKASSEGKIVSLAGAIAGKTRAGATHITVTGVGPGAVLVMLKALARASGFLATDNVRLVIFPDFMSMMLSGMPAPGSSSTTTPDSTTAGAAMLATPALTDAVIGPAADPGVVASDHKGTGIILHVLPMRV